MKKLMMAVAAFGMLLASCQNDRDFVQNGGGTSTVPFLVSTPEGTFSGGSQSNGKCIFFTERNATTEDKRQSPK